MFLPRKNIVWVESITAKIALPRRPINNRNSFSTELLWLNVCFWKTFGGDFIYARPKLMWNLDFLWDNAQNGPWIWMTRIRKNVKKVQGQN